MMVWWIGTALLAWAVLGFGLAVFVGQAVRIAEGRPARQDARTADVSLPDAV